MMKEMSGRIVSSRVKSCVCRRLRTKVCDAESWFGPRELGSDALACVVRRMTEEGRPAFWRVFTSAPTYCMDSSMFFRYIVRARTGRRRA